MSGSDLSMTNRSKNRLVWMCLVVAPVLFAAIAALQVSIDARTRSVASQKQELLLRSAPLVKKLSLG